ncbi:hypothetical protein D3C77_312120 [compost metagenome]
MLAVHFLDLPQSAGQCEAISWRRYGRNASNLLGAVIYRMLFVILEHRVEAEVVYDLLAAKPDNQRAFFCLLNMVRLQQILQQLLELLRLYAAECWQGQHGLRQLGRLCFADAFKRAHRLMVEDAYWLTAQIHRLYPTFADV